MLAYARRRATSGCLAPFCWLARPAGESLQYFGLALVVPVGLAELFDLLLEQWCTVGQVAVGDRTGYVLHCDVSEGFADPKQVGQEREVPHPGGAAWWFGLVLLLVYEV